MLFKINYLLIFFFTPLILSCSNADNSSYKNFKNKIKEISHDSKVSKEEYLELKDNVVMTEDDWAKEFQSESQDIIDDKLVKFIIDTAQEKDISLSESDIWQPVNNISNKPYSAHLLIENSASMDGYVNNSTDFEASIFTLLSNLKASKNIALVDYGFIDSSIIDNTHKIDNINQIKKFTENLDANFLKNQSNNRSSSDIAQVISLATQKQNSEKGDVAILISDFIFSPPNSNNASNYLSTQGAYLKGFISNKINTNNGDLAVWIVKLSSKFNGTYFDQNNRPHKINTDRPYYIWFFGNNKQIQQLSKSIDIKSLPNYKNDAKFTYSAQPEKFNFSILTTTLIGDSPTAKFNVENALTNNIINGAKTIKDSNGFHKFIFEVAIDLNSILDKNELEYYLDIDNYSTDSDLFKVANIRAAKPSDQKKIQSATHVIMIEFAASNANSQKIPKTKLKIDINQNLPKWIKKSSTDDDKEIGSNPNLKDKTFGLYQLINPVFQAFYAKNSTIGYIEIFIEP